MAWDRSTRARPLGVGAGSGEVRGLEGLEESEVAEAALGGQPVARGDGLLQQSSRPLVVAGSGEPQ
ncbi:hypothetical protein SAMN04489730_2495 [Amycolatopsis australiensis]|uniref:Uncharacterized protein n=1 Tax=Amycolatopsis australiensis TaxID=546364 RepID=A0A1K1R0X2_9PSEU|nr:hypothetical protein SAMN04489730_2495 [Amycolatopsis australiensis]